MRFIKTAKRFILKHKLTLFIFAIFFIPRVIDLGWDVYGIDAGRWDRRSDKFISAVLEGEFMETNQKYHPGVTVMWLSGISKKIFYELFNLYTGYKPTIVPGTVYPKWFFINTFLAKIPLVLSISALLTYSVMLLKRLKVPLSYLLIFSITLSLEPFYLGITRFFHLSGLESATAFAALITAIYAANKNSLKYYLASGFILGLALLTKTSGLLLLPFLGLTIFSVVFYINFKKKKLVKSFLTSLFQSVKFYVLLLIAASFTFFILWPAMWMEPFWVIQDIIRSGLRDTAFSDPGNSSLLGSRYLYYYEMLFTRSMGLTFISFVLAVPLFLKESNKKIKYLVLFGLLFVVYYNFAMSFPSKLKDRYLINEYPFFMLISSYFLYKIYEFREKLICRIFLVGVLVYYGLNVYAYHPVYSSYHTDLLGGLKGYSNITKLPNRGEYYVQVTQFLNKKDGEDSYNMATVTPEGETDRSAKGYFGTIYTHDGLVPKGYADYYAAEYQDFDDVHPSCKPIHTIGPRFPYKFDFITIFEC